MSMTRERYGLIWEAVLQIPPGRVASYGQVAEEAGLPGRARLVGRALHALPENSHVPWHRVVRADGRLAFASESESFVLQRSLLESEGVAAPGGRVSMRRFGWHP